MKRAFLAAADPALATRLATEPALEATLAALLTQAREAHPQLAIEPEGFVGHLASRLAPDADLAELEALHGGDLGLAFACARQDPVALQLLQREHLERIRQALSRQGASGLEVDEVLSALGTRLFVAADGRPGIAGYSGRGALSQWLRAAAVRALIDLRRVERPTQRISEAVLASLPSLSPTPEHALSRQEARAAFATAFTEALAALSDRERLLLRMHSVEGATIDDIGALYQVHRTTAFRWVEAARLKVADGVRARLREALKLDTAQLASLTGFMQSAIDISLRSALAE